MIDATDSCNLATASALLRRNSFTTNVAVQLVAVPDRPVDLGPAAGSVMRWQRPD